MKYPLTYLSVVCCLTPPWRRRAVTLGKGADNIPTMGTVVAPKMHELGAGDAYFDVHVEADEHHSIMGLEYIDPQDANSVRGKKLIAKAWRGLVYGHRCCIPG
jgi:hypothetical protein